MSGDPVTVSSFSLFRVSSIVVLILTIGVLFGMWTPLANTQNLEDPVTLTREAFTRISEVYRSGGEAPELVAKLNVAIGQIQEAQFARSKGDEADAIRLEEQARTEISEIMADIPGAQERAQHDSTIRLLTVVASIPVVVIVSTFMFYLGLRTWRWYEKMRLFEMRIVEKKKEVD